MKTKVKRLHVYSFISKIKNLTYIFSIPLILEFTLRFILRNISVLSSVSYLLYFYIFSILIFSVLVCLKFWIYLNEKISFKNNEVIFKSGILTKKEILINLSDTPVISFEQTLITKFFKAYKTFFTFNRRLGYLKKGIFLRKNQVEDLKKELIKKDLKIIFNKIKFYDLILLSFSYNNIIFSAILGISILKKFQNQLGIKISTIINKNAPIFINPTKLSSIISPIAYIILSVVILIFLINIIKLWDLSIKKSRNRLILQKGAVYSSISIIDVANIYAISFKANLINICFNKKIMYIHTAKVKSGSRTLVVALVDSKFGNNFSFSEKKSSNQEIFKIYPDKKALPSYLYVPILFQILTWGISAFLPVPINKAIIFLSLLISAYLIFIRVYSFKKSHLKLTSETIKIRAYRGFFYYEAIIPIIHLKMIKIKQSPFQILSKRCNVYIYSSFSIEECFKIKQLNVNNVEKFVETLENSHIIY